MSEILLKFFFQKPKDWACVIRVVHSESHPKVLSGRMLIPLIGNLQSARFSLQQKEYGILGHLTLAETVLTC